MPTQYLPKQGYLPNRGELRVDVQSEKHAAAVAARPQRQPSHELIERILRGLRRPD
jgi:hypothetical protein